MKEIIIVEICHVNDISQGIPKGRRFSKAEEEIIIKNLSTCVGYCTYYELDKSFLNLQTEIINAEVT